jgi:hypothetical protein
MHGKLRSGGRIEKVERHKNQGREGKRAIKGGKEGKREKRG